MYVSVPGIIGSLQALEAIKIACKLECILSTLNHILIVQHYKRVYVGDFAVYTPLQTKFWRGI